MPIQCPFSPEFWVTNYTRSPGREPYSVSIVFRGRWSRARPKIMGFECSGRNRSRVCPYRVMRCQPLPHLQKGRYNDWVLARALFFKGVGPGPEAELAKASRRLDDFGTSQHAVQKTSSRYNPFPSGPRSAPHVEPLGDMAVHHKYIIHSAGALLVRIAGEPSA